MGGQGFNPYGGPQGTQIGMRLESIFYLFDISYFIFLIHHARESFSHALGQFGQFNNPNQFNPMNPLNPLNPMNPYGKHLLLFVFARESDFSRRWYQSPEPAESIESYQPFRSH